MNVVIYCGCTHPSSRACVALAACLEIKKRVSTAFARPSMVFASTTPWLPDTGHKTWQNMCVYATLIARSPLYSASDTPHHCPARSPPLHFVILRCGFWANRGTVTAAGSSRSTLRARPALQEASRFRFRGGEGGSSRLEGHARPWAVPVVWASCVPVPILMLMVRVCWQDRQQEVYSILVPKLPAVSIAAVVR